MDLSGFRSLLNAKCSIKNVTFQTTDDFFRKPMFSYIERTWKQWLGPLVPNLPPFDIVVKELRPKVTSLLANF